MARKKATKSSEKFVYRFTAEHGPEDFPTLGRTFTKRGELHESGVPIEHARLVLVSSPEKKEEKEGEI